MADGTCDSYTNGLKTATLGPGSTIGEQALLHNTTYPATVTTTSVNTALWTIDRITFRSLLAHSTQRRRTCLLDLLTRVPFLKPLALHELRKLLDGLQTQYFSPGQVIVKEGTITQSCLYLVEEGKALSCRNDILIEEYNPGKGSERKKGMILCLSLAYASNAFHSFPVFPLLLSRRLFLRAQLPTPVIILS